MWLYPKVVGFNPPERWGHSACFFEGVVYVFGVCILSYDDMMSINQRLRFCSILLIPSYPAMFSL